MSNVSDPPMTRGVLLTVLLLLVSMLDASILGCTRRTDRLPTKGSPTIVSLAPALTETLFALGVGDRVVGVSDYCAFPPRAKELPKVGSALTPNYEALARLTPDLILVTRGASPPQPGLARLGRLVSFDWLTLDDVVTSTLRLAALVGSSSRGQELARRYRRGFQSRISPHCLRVLLVIGQVPGRLGEVWYVRRNSLHGQLLSAAAACNAIDRDVEGQPRLSLEQVFGVDPDAIVVLATSAAESTRLAADWNRLTELRAVQNGNVAVLSAPEIEVPGPRLIKFIDRLSRVLAKMRSTEVPSRTDRTHPVGSGVAP